MQVSGQLHASAAVPLGNNSGTNWAERWVGPRAGLHEEKILSVPGFEHRSSSLYPSHYTD
jgi:hypothetical protein